MKRNGTFVTTVAAQIYQNLGNSVRAMAHEMKVHYKTITKTIIEDLRMKSYVMSTCQLLTDVMKGTRKLKAVALLNDLKHDTRA